jgi:hypothetical protein
MLIIKNNNKVIKNFTIYAERHCGTNFLENYISSTHNHYAEDKPLSITWDYGWKHFFGFQDNKIQINGSDTLFVGIVRNPYNWLKAMYNKPHHFRNWDENFNNKKVFSNMKDFLESEITSIAQNKDILGDFHIYEKRKYFNIFELRETKNRYLIDVLPKIAENYILINYETLYENLQDFIMTINNNFKIKLKNFVPNNFNKQDYSITEPEILDLINNNLNWKTENFLGYKKRIYT